MPMPMPVNATSEPISSPAVPGSSGRNTNPSVANAIDNSATRSKPKRRSNAGVATPVSANAAVGNMPSAPMMGAPKAYSSAMRSSSGVSDVTAVRKLNAESRIAASTRPRPRNWADDEDAVVATDMTDHPRRTRMCSDA
ncbi:cell wall-associated hydrolases (invasion-associated proteins) [Xanthomonas oryzae pv. oryzae KACC 10331]|uniref:Cell wall-associated hydrolases (Invasion-associated proteins) n=1 Tax=Xanthomonas oryzae pv. oryzae (strain KACC10331 / KXO85) TaxID=291331 RepID=Q05HX2_XANOR|nr:cell wall-associated hydrolases (invasion-associated proteins) [Xanthomonas oryzae pv. oryzae KACC 10331]